MNIFVGTLYSGENEFAECLASIGMQTYTYFKHFIFDGLPNKEAHRALFSSFIAKSNDFDLLIKVDADMVLTSPLLFEKIVKKMFENDWIYVYSIAVHDFFTGEMINGLNTYRNTVRWDFSKETMFVDIPKVPKENTFYDKSELAPAAFHCKNPSKYQAFHYGVHRGLKSIQKIHSTTHWALLEKVWKNFQKTDDVRIGLAIFGAELVFDGQFSKEDVDYTNPRLANAIEQYQEMSSSQVRREIQRLRLKNWGILPGDLRRRMLRKKFST